MKNLLLTAAFILSCFLQLQASNTPNASVLSVAQNEKSIILNSQNNSSGVKEITILDSSGEIIFSDVVESDKKRIKYDLKVLSDADYTIKVVDSKVINIYEAQIVNDKIEILNQKSYFKPTIANVNGKILVKAELENKENIFVSIYDNNNVLVFEQKTEKENSFTQPFNLQQLPKGQYKILVSSKYFMEQMKVSL